jgi:NADPH:quinone reductase-like Zn-dependent oxidoreductase
MRSAVFSQFGDPSKVLSLDDRPVPQPAVGQIRVKTSLAAIHNHDLLTINGDYGLKPDLPAVAGTEAAGVVDAVGEGVSHLRIGQRVAASGQGTWADYYLASAAAAVPLPDSISDAAGAQLVSMPLSALTLLDFVGVEKGDWIIQNAANGAVGKALAMFAAGRGIKVINLVRRAEAVAELADLGIDDVVSSSQEGWRDTVKALTGGASIKAAIDAVGGSSSGDLLSVLGENGLLVSFGLMSGQPMQLSAGDMVFKQAVVKGFWLAKIAPAMAPEKLQSMVGEIVSAAAAGKLPLDVAEIFSLDQIGAACAAAAQAGRKGKVLVRP